MHAELQKLHFPSGIPFVGEERHAGQVLTKEEKLER
jgi:hypothetical protein